MIDRDAILGAVLTLNGKDAGPFTIEDATRFADALWARLSPHEWVVVGRDPDGYPVLTKREDKESLHVHNNLDEPRRFCYTDHR